ncbi:uncharacterized protein LOC115874872 [Sitophilus oryzae]|uniref:Uncharacterized protein LOC115874872 n=1 Tax=Sitophilus oryzae TaxID=7048 RepID=A0A6J2X4U4_SITOR|nr:uncharacterized protein LOC115874872 [Sitophilus oryzae]
MTLQSLILDIIVRFTLEFDLVDSVSPTPVILNSTGHCGSCNLSANSREMKLLWEPGSSRARTNQDLPLASKTLTFAVGRIDNVAAFVLFIICPEVTIGKEFLAVEISHSSSVLLLVVLLLLGVLSKLF